MKNSKFVVLTLSLLVLFGVATLAGCGGSGGSSSTPAAPAASDGGGSSPTPAASGSDASPAPARPSALAAPALTGTYYLVDAVFDGETLSEGDFFSFGFDEWSIEFLDDSNMQAYMMGEYGDGSYRISGSTLTLTVEGEEMSMKLDGDRIIMEDEDGTFVYDKVRRQPDPAAAAAADNASLAEAVAWWSGDWYGYWYVFSASDAYGSLIGEAMDVYAHINVGANGRGTVYLWSDDVELGTVEIEIKAPGGGAGVLISTGGDLFLYPIDTVTYSNYWEVDTADGMHYDDNLIVIMDEFVDDDMDKIDYKIELRPWGMRWDHEFDTQPPYYDWYLSVYNRPMLDVLRDYDTLHSALQ